MEAQKQEAAGVRVSFEFDPLDEKEGPVTASQAERIEVAAAALREAFSSLVVAQKALKHAGISGDGMVRISQAASWVWIYRNKAERVAWMARGGRRG